MRIGQKSLIRFEGRFSINSYSARGVAEIIAVLLSMYLLGGMDSYAGSPDADVAPPAKVVSH